MSDSNLDPWPASALEATLGLPTGQGAPDDLPPLWHWLYFLPTASRSSMGPDGHSVNQEWVDSTLRRRRLFAAARTDFLRPLKIGQRAQMTERIVERRNKRGRSGDFQMVTAEYQYFQDGLLCVREERDIVYLQGAVQRQRQSADDFVIDPVEPDSWNLELKPDPVMLFRYSALTFNAHLIHFDQLYTQREEGYPERVVHGPFVAIVLARLLALNGIQRIRRFEFRARSPLYVNQPIRFTGKPAADRITLRALGPGGVLAMEAGAWPA